MQAGRRYFCAPHKSIYIYDPSRHSCNYTYIEKLSKIKIIETMAVVNKTNLLLLLLSLFLTLNLASAQLRRNFYAGSCPNVEQIVRNAVQKKVQQTFTTIPATLRLYFHDCFVNVKYFIFNDNFLFLRQIISLFCLIYGLID